MFFPYISCFVSVDILLLGNEKNVIFLWYVNLVFAFWFRQLNVACQVCNVCVPTGREADSNYRRDSRHYDQSSHLGRSGRTESRGYRRSPNSRYERQDAY